MTVSFSGRPPIVAVPAPTLAKSDDSTPDPAAIKAVLVTGLLNAKGQGTASDCVQDSDMQLIGDELRIQTSVSKAMLPLVVNAEAIRIMTDTLREYSLSGVKLKFLPAQPKPTVDRETNINPVAIEGVSKNVSASFKKLSSTAAKLNAISDSLSSQIEQIDTSLKRLNLGVIAWVKIQADCDEDGNWFKEELGYTKVGNRWCVAIKTASGMQGDPNGPDTSFWAFADAPRQLRIRAIEHIPALIENLCTEADSMIKQLEPKVQEVAQLTMALNSLGGAR
jgi:hypothetical protein